MTYKNYMDLRGAELRRLEKHYADAGSLLGQQFGTMRNIRSTTSAERKDFGLFVQAVSTVVFAISYERHIAEASGWDEPAHDVFEDHIGYALECKHLGLEVENHYLDDWDWVEEMYEAVIKHYWTLMDSLAQVLAT